MRIAFAGSPSAGATVLRALDASTHDPVIVVSQPDRPRGRSGRPRPTPVSEAARELGRALIRPASINSDEAMAALREAQVGALCVVGFGQILKAPLLREWPCLNVHFSLLPAYRGAAPVERALMDGLRRTGVTIMQMDEGLDTGPTIAAAAVDVGDDEDAGALTERLAERGAALLVDALGDLEAGRLATRPQPDAGVSMAPKITAADRPLDPRRAARALAAQVRALSPHIGATLAVDGTRLVVWRAAAVAGTVLGPALERAGERLLLRCSEGALELRELQPPGRRRMAAADFLRGYRGPLALSG